MSLPVINLDDRQYDELVAEAQDRLRQALPELAGLSPGDPLYYLVDLFAHLTEQLIQRANLIPERQRQVFLNLMAIPRRPAQPSRGLVSLDLQGKALMPKLVPAETALAGAGRPFVSEQEVLATPLQLRLLVKRAGTADLGQLSQLYPELDPARIRSFAPQELVPGRDPLHTRGTVDDALYLALCVPKALSKPQPLAQLRRALVGQTLNIGLVPQREALAEGYTRPAPRQLEWSIAWCRRGDGPQLDCRYLPLTQLDDSSDGARQPGVVRLALPEAEALLTQVQPLDPADAGLGDSPPALPEDLAPESLICWLRLRAPRDPLDLSYLALNAVLVSGQTLQRDLVLGIGDGEANQRLQLAQSDIEPESLRLEVEQDQAFRPWYGVPHFAASGADDPVYRFDPVSRLLQFGDGVHGRRPPRGARIRVASLRHGGGAGGNLPPGSISSAGSPIPGVRVRQDYPTWGGLDAEGVSAAERRIAAFLRHRNRAVTEQDFIQLTRHNPLNPVARAELLPGFHPGREFADARDQVPGVVSLLVLPPAQDDGRYPKPTAGLLSDVHQYLSERMLLGTELFVLSPQFIPLGITAAFEALDPTRAQQQEQAVEQALAAYLWPLAPGGLNAEGWQLGRTVEASELYTAIARVAGVRAIHRIQLWVQTDGAWQPAADNRVQIPRYGLPELSALTLSGEGVDAALELLPQAPAPTASDPALVPVPVLPEPC